MTQNNKIIAGGGWVSQTVRHRPITHTLTQVSVVLFGLSTIACVSYFVVTLEGATSAFNPTVGALIFIPPFIGFAASIIARLSESPKEISKQAPNPKYDPRNLY